jgi:hypothetical protein
VDGLCTLGSLPSILKRLLRVCLVLELRAAEWSGFMFFCLVSGSEGAEPFRERIFVSNLERVASTKSVDSARSRYPPSGAVRLPPLSLSLTRLPLPGAGPPSKMSLCTSMGLVGFASLPVAASSNPAAGAGLHSVASGASPCQDFDALMP